MVEGREGEGDRRERQTNRDRVRVFGKKGGSEERGESDRRQTDRDRQTDRQTDRVSGEKA